jgi:hypothetical protein
MPYKHTLTKWLIAASIGLTSCTLTSNPSGPRAGKGSFSDLGFIPAAVSAGNSGFDFQSAIYNNNRVFVATSDGIWMSNIDNKEWSRAGLDGKVVTMIYKHPAIANRFFAGTQSDGTAEDKTFYISSNGGESWEAADNVIFDETNNKYETYVCLAARPNHPDHIYANLEGGTMIAVSTDGGLNWARMNGATESYFGYACNIAFMPGKADEIFQGAENPLDDAWLGKYHIDADNPSTLSDFEKIIDQSVFGNRRPNELQAFDFVPNTLYAGLEGALYKVTATSNKPIFKSENNNFPYTYITALSVDAANNKHLLFGGALNNSSQPMCLYETYDEGKSITRIDNKLGLENPEVIEILATKNSNSAAIVLNDQGANKVKLVLYQQFLPD